MTGPFVAASCVLDELDLLDHALDEIRQPLADYELDQLIRLSNHFHAITMKKIAAVVGGSMIRSGDQQ